MAKISYLGANVETTDTFAQWLVRTNQIVYDMGTVVLTAGAVAQPNNTNGAETTGNTHLEGIFSANTVAIVDNIRGGTVSTPANMTVTSNVDFTSADLVTFRDTVGAVHANTNVLFTRNFTVNAPNDAVIFTANTFSSNVVTSSFVGGTVNLFTNSVNVGQDSFATLTVESSTTVNGPINATNSVEMSTATQPISIGTSQTTGILTLGSTAGTAPITVGRSALTQTVNLGTGSTQSGATKTVNIGTGGVAGSTTTINIGSNNSLTDVFNDMRLNGNFIIGTQPNKATIQYTTNTARTYTIPQVGSNADFVMTAGTQSIAGNKTFTGNTSYTGTLTGATGIVNIGAGQFYKDAAGNVGVGTTSPTAALHIAAGDVHVSGGDRSFTNTGNNSLAFGTNNLQRMVILANGNVGIGIADPSESLHVSGKIRLGSQATATTDAVRADRSITTGDGLSGGGNFTANRTFTVDGTVVRTSGDQTIGGVKTFAANTVFNGDSRFNSDLYVNGDLIVDGESALTTSEAFITDLTVFGTFRMFAGSGVISNITPNAPAMYDLGTGALPWRDVYAHNVLLSTAGTTTTSAVRADRTLQLSAGSNITITGAGTSAQNLTANRSWTISAASTNLGTTANTTSRTITSSTGTNVVLPISTSTEAGVMSSADKNKLDGIAAGAQVNVGTNLGTSATTIARTITSSTGSNTTIPAATSTEAGVLTSADKNKLDGIAAGAEVNVGTNLSTSVGTSSININSSTGNNTTIPGATTTAAGLITTGSQSWAGIKTFTSTISGSIDGNASTATTLANARTINGTSFDGSGNITTSFWGTTRTLTVGGTGKSVNGSGNVSWSLSEIGVNNSTLTLATSGIASGSQTWTSNQGSNATFTVNVPGTNLSVSGTGNTRTITSSTGNNITIPVATTSLAGWMSTSDKSKLDGIAAGAQVNVGTNLGTSAGSSSITITSSTGNNTTISGANSGTAGLITTGSQTISGTKTFLGSILITGTSTSPDLLVERTNATSNANMRFLTTSATDVTIGQGDSAWFNVGSGNDIRHSQTGVFRVSASSGNVETKGTISTGGVISLGSQASSTSHAVRADRSVSAGNGLTGGGNFTSDVTITLGTPGTLTGSTSNSVSGSSHTHAITVNLGTSDGTTAGPTITCSAGSNATIPVATPSRSGVVTTAMQSFSGTKIFDNGIRSASIESPTDTDTYMSLFNNQYAFYTNSGRQIYTLGPRTYIGGAADPSNTSDFNIATASFNVRSTTANTNGSASIHSHGSTTGTRMHMLFSNPNGVVGSISTTASTTVFSTSSDYRLKDVTGNISESAKKLMALKPITFSWKTDPAKSEVMGFLAHEVQEIVPDAVVGEKDKIDPETGKPEYQQVDHSKLVPLLTAALQETIAELEKLKAEVAEMKKAANQ